MSEQRIFSDLDLTFAKHPITKDVSKKTKENAIIGSVKNILMTRFYERPFNPNLGSNIYNLLFEPVDFVTASILSKEITMAINNFEPRVSLKEIVVTPDNNNQRYDVTLTFFIINSVKPVTVALFLERLR
jgi:phage baseplate assembly protein W